MEHTPPHTIRVAWALQLDEQDRPVVLWEVGDRDQPHAAGVTTQDQEAPCSM